MGLMGGMGQEADGLSSSHTCQDPTPPQIPLGLIGLMPAKEMV